MPVNTRRAALRIISEVEEGGYFNLILKRELKGMEEQEKRFTSALCFTTLENLRRIDYVIDAFTKGKRVHAFVRNVLRLGVCQLLFFESVPESAAVNESVKLMEKSPKRQLKGFVNAVLRQIALRAGDLPYPSREEEPALFLSVMYSYPLWLAEKYIREYGMDFAEEMLSYKKEGADTCVRRNARKVTAEQWENKLTGAGFAFFKGEYSPAAWYIRNISAVDQLGLYKKGVLTVQGEASMLAVEAAHIRGGEAVLDVCAAPGGKAAYAAEFGPSRLVAQDLHPHRVKLMERHLPAWECRRKPAWRTPPCPFRNTMAPLTASWWMRPVRRWGCYTGSRISKGTKRKKNWRRFRLCSGKFWRLVRAM